jgi:hypothetical protein
LSFTRSNSSICGHAGNWPAASGIVHEDMSFQKSLPLLFGLILFLLSPAGFAQPGAANSVPSGSGAAPAVSAASVSGIVQPALSDIQSTVGLLNTGRWKAPNEVKAAADRNLSSIQRDLVETLPKLLNQADAAAGSVPAAFAVYRNIDALYDVLLRVSETAMLAAPDNDASAVASALDRLESARRQLGDAIVASAQDRDAQIIRLQAAVKAATTVAPPPPAKATVVEDGPPAPAAKKKRKPAAKPAAKPPATNAGSGTTPPSSN